MEEKHQIDYLKYIPDEKLMELSTRASGRTTRLVDELIQRFFTLPIGTKIYFTDHYGYQIGQHLLFELFAKRLEMEHHCKCRRGKDVTGDFVIREEKTYHELVVEELNRRKEKIIKNDVKLDDR